jgi:glycosyltransferase involved in cell wall biosynthesis
MNELQEEVADADLKTISIRGSLRDEEVQEVCEDTDVFINPHIVRLGHIDAIFPFKIVEYLSFGKPVVSTQLAQSELGHLGGFQLSESDDPKAIASAVRTCTSNYSAFEARMPAIREFVWEHYSVEQVGKRLRNFLTTAQS